MALLVQTKSGTGKVVGEIPGKAMVEILNDDCSPKMKDGKPVKVLVRKKDAIHVGFLDGGPEFDEAYYGSNPGIDVEYFKTSIDEDNSTE